SVPPGSVRRLTSPISSGGHWCELPARMAEPADAVPAPPRAPPRSPPHGRGEPQLLSPTFSLPGSSRNKIHANSAAAARDAALDPFVGAVRAAVRAELQDCLGGPLREAVRTELTAALEGWLSHSGGTATLGLDSSSRVGGPPAGAGGCGSAALARRGAEIPRAEGRVSIQHDDEGFLQTSDPDRAAESSIEDTQSREEHPIEEHPIHLLVPTSLRRMGSSFGRSLFDANDGGDNHDGLLAKVSERSKALSESLGLRTRWLNEEPPRSGRLASFVDGPVFKLFFGAVVLVNIWFIIQDANVRIRSPADHSMPAANSVFLVLYVLEAVLKLAVHRLWFFIGDDWKVNLLDMTVVISDGATLVLGTTFTLRFLPLVKVVKLLELMHHSTHLQAFIVCIHGSFRNFMWSVVMLFSVYGVFSLLFMQIITSHIDAIGETLDDTTFGEHFGSVGGSITTLFMATTGGEDWAIAYTTIKETGAIGSFLFLAFVVFVNLNLLNIILGIFVDSAMKVLSPDPVKLAHEYISRDQKYAMELVDLCQNLDPEGLGRLTHLTQEQFELGLSQKRIPHLLAMLDLKKHNIRRIFSAMAAHDGQVEITQFVEICMLLKGASTTFDLHQLRVNCDIRHSEIRRKLSKIIQMLLDITATGGRQYSHSSLPAPSSVSHLRP
ncbi:unnamed protein product, partial [Prorocentrum cordatum]